MSNLNITLRLRPIRFAFIVRPDDSTSLIEIFRVNTCLWGGKFNPIIPYFQRIPKWWEKSELKFENARQIINGYLDFFEPDFLVEAEKGLADGLGFAEERVLQLNEILLPNSNRIRGLEAYGLSVRDIYLELYKKEFQFQQRYKQDIVYMGGKKEEFINFTACVFGRFPLQNSLKYFEKNFKQVFEPILIDLDAESLSNAYKLSNISPLIIGHTAIKVNYHENLDPTLFIMDFNEPKDLLDFWNLRAIHQNVLAIPIQWIKELSPYCKEFILENYRPLPGNSNGVMIRTISMFSRSIAEKNIMEIYEEYLRVEKNGANTIQTWYPPIWRESPEHTFRTTRPTLNAGSKRLGTVIDENSPEISFEPLFPEFYPEYSNHFSLVNVVNFQDMKQGHIATVFPCNYKNPTFPKFGIGRKCIVPTTEGLVFFPHKNIDENWILEDGTTALNTWFNTINIGAKFSDAGRATQQIIQTLGGFRGIDSLAHQGIICLLNEMANKPINKSAHYKEFSNKIQSSVNKGKQQERILETLIARKVVKLGLEIKCPKCDNWSWHAVDKLDYALSCGFCLKQVDFPLMCPTDGRYSRWAYHLIGPFALPDYAKGGYAASLAIHFFGNVIGDIHNLNVTWSAGQELTLSSGKIAEIDFSLWCQRKCIVGNDYITEIVFGEAKSFGKEAFKQRDIDQMKLVAEEFPCSILVFATMKKADDLSKNEINRIKKLAEWGRKYDKERKRSRAPVILLTGIELFISYDLKDTWIQLGGKHKEFANLSWKLTNLRGLADVTQQLYLGMPSYANYLEDNWKKRVERKNNKTITKLS